MFLNYFRWAANYDAAGMDYTVRLKCIIFWVTVRSGLRMFVSFFIQIIGRFLTEWGRKILTPD